MVLRRAAAAVLAAAVLLPTAASARVEIPARAVMAMGFGNSIEFADGHKYNANILTAAQSEAAIRTQIEDAYAMGVRVFLYDAASTNSATHLYRLARWNAAARAFNTANPADKICISPMYEDGSAGTGTTDGALPMFDAADAGGAASPLCTLGNKPVVAIWGSGTCINPLPAISARGPFSVIVTVFNNGINRADSSCITTLKNSGATGSILSYIWASGNSAFSNESHVASQVTAIHGSGTGVEFVMGIGNARAQACGDGGNGPKSPDYQLTDLKYWWHYLEGWRLAVANSTRVMLTMGAPGDLGENSYISSALVCDPRDQMVHNVDSAGINRGFSCPNVPDDFTAALPAAFHKSTSLPLWNRSGFHRAQKVWSQWLRTGSEPAADEPFVAYAYRQHKWGLTGSWQVCPNGAYTIQPASIGGVFQGDYIALTSWAPTPTRVQVELAGAIIYDGTLPAKQMKLSGDAKQTLVPVGDRVGRPIIRVFNGAGDVIASSTGKLKITTTPKHWGGKTGRNPGMYAGFVDFATGGGWAGIRIGSTGNVRSNLVRDISGAGIMTSDNADNVDVAGNTVVRTQTGISIGSRADAGLGRSMATANNIIATATLGIGISGDVASGAVYPNNLFHSVTTAMAPAVASVATGTVTGNPLFVGATDFRLQSGSPARDAGLAAYGTGADRDGRARGSTPDIGAYEYYDPTTRSPCTAHGSDPVDPCAPGGASYPCSEPPTPDACIPPPTLTSPTNISVGANGGTWTLAADQDAMITCQDLVVTKTITIIGGRKVHLRGCEVVLAWDGVTSALNREALKIVGTQEAYVEGSIFDANDRCDAVAVALKGSGLTYDNTATKMTLVNVWTGNNNYNKLDGACVGNCVDIQGDGQPGTVDLYADRLTCLSKGEGLFIPDRQPGGTNTIDLKRTNARFGPNGVPRFDIFMGGLVHYYFSGWTGMDPNVQVRLSDVYSDWNKSGRNVAPGPDVNLPSAVDFSDPNQIRFTGSNFSGIIQKGIPPAGDFAPRAKLGRVYNRSEFCQ